MDTAIRHRVNVARAVIRDEVGFFRKQFGQVPSEWKEDATRVTFADFAISERILHNLRNSFRDDDLCSEESNPLDEILDLKAKYGWVLDPIDGTNNYAMGLPFCGIALALLKWGEPVYGLVYDYARDRLIEGGPGCPLLDGGRRVHAHNRALDERSSVIGMHFPLPAPVIDPLTPVLTRYRLRSLGSGALNLAYTAIGLLDGCIDFKVKVWDIAACVALLRAADYSFVPLGETAFPLKTFHVRAPIIPFYAGTRPFCAFVRSLDLESVVS